MAAAAFSKRKGMYSWWWDSHISPKNSKWLQENLTDMDVKVKQMIKLIEEDADSFARRAEMYYKKRPELMKLVEEFYRAYRALAERYDHATGALRQAHKTMSEAFPNQVPLMLSDDSLGGSLEFDPRTPDMSDPNDSGSHFPSYKRNGASNDLAEGRARRGLTFADEDSKEGHDGAVSSQKNPNNSYSEMLASAETEIQKLKEELAKLQVQKETRLAQCQQSLEKSSKLESELKSVQEERERLQEQARLAEADVQSVKEALAKLGAEKEDHLLQYEQCVEKVTSLENRVSSLQKENLEFHGRANDVEVECMNLKQKMSELEAEKKAADDQYKDCLLKISTLEEKSAKSEENAQNITERAEKAEIEVENLKEQLAKLFAEKEMLNSQCQQYLAMMSELECKISAAEEETKRLNAELKDGMTKLKDAEGKCVQLEGTNQILHLELESAAQKMANQTQELSEKQQELGNLWTAIQEERLRFLEAETAFQTLQHLHTQSQEELMSLNLQLQNRNQILNDIEIRNLGLEDEIRKVQQDNQNLGELNVSSSLTVQTLQEEILSLRDTIKKFEAEIELRVDERNALQQEIYCLKEELNDLNKKHRGVLDEKSELMEKHERECDEKAVLLIKLTAMEKLIEKNTVLENSLSDLNVELDAVREKVKSLEENCERLLEEKAGLTGEKDSLISKLQDMTEKCDDLIEKNKLLENSLCDANVEIEEMRVKLKGVEESCLLLGGEKSILSNEKENLLSELAVSRQKTEELEMKKSELEASSSLLVEEKESGLREIAKLMAILEVERLEHVGFAQSSKRELGEKELQLLNLEKELRCRSDEYENEVEKNLLLELNLLILHASMQDLGERTTVLSSSYCKLERVSKSYEEQILHLEQENVSRQAEIESLTGQIKSLQPRLCQMKTMVLAGADYDFGDNAEHDPILLDSIIFKVRDLKHCLAEAEEEDLRLLTQNMVLNTLLNQMSLDLADTISERNTLCQNYRTRFEQFSLLQRQEEKTKEMVEELRLEVLQGLFREVVLRNEMKLLHEQLTEMQATLRSLNEQNCVLNYEKSSLRGQVNGLSTEISALEEEINAISDESMSQAFDYLVFKYAAMQKFVEIKKSLEIMQVDKLQLEGLFVKSEDELKTVTLANDTLNREIADKKIALSQTESRLSEAEQMLKAFEMQKDELLEKLNNLRSEHLGLQTVKDDQHSQIQRLSRDHQDRSMELESTREAKRELELCLSKLLQENEEHKIREIVLRNEMKLLHEQLTEMHATLRSLNEQSCVLNYEKSSLRGQVNGLSTEISALEEEINAISDESMSQAFDYLVFKYAVMQKFVEIKESQEIMQMDKLKLEGLLVKSEDELKTVTSANDTLNREIADKKIALSQTESRLSEAEQKLKVFVMQKEELLEELNNLRSEHLELQMVKDDQHSQIQRLSRDHQDRSVELESTREAKRELELCLSKLLQENEEHKIREESITGQLEKQRDEISRWEAQATGFWDSGISAGIREALLEEKIFELSESYISRIESKDEEVHKLKGMVRTLEGQNAGLNVIFAGYVSEIASLDKCVSSIERRTALCKEQAEPDENVQLRSIAHDADGGDSQEAVKHVSPTLDGLSGLQNLQRRIEAVEKTILEKEKLAAEESENINAKLYDATQEIEKLKMEIVVAQENSREPGKLQDRVTNDSARQKNKMDVNEAENELLTKDIMLDHVSECSSYSLSRRGTAEVEDQLLEFRDTAEKSGKMNEDEGRKEHRSLNPSTDSFSEKELGIEKLDNFGSFSETNPETKKKKILERLDSDAQKLGHLQITVEDLKRKVGTCEKGGNGKDFLISDVKAQLEDTEASITKLLDLNRNLVKNVEDGLFLSARSSQDFENRTNISRRRVSEQARQGYEKIGRLQAEVQKLQLLLAKLDDEKGSRGTTRVADYKKSVLLRDYLYGGNSKRKKAGFCSCIRPSTEEY